MTRQDDCIRLRHMLEFACKCVRFTEGKSRSDLDQDEILTLATLYAIEFLGEASRTISEELRERHSEVPWAEIIGTRNRLAHGYAEVSLDVIWTIVKKDIPPLIQRLEKVIEIETGNRL
jgi:uncharacterized protein with HEPN domain